MSKKGVLPLVSIIVPVYNSITLIEPFLDSLLRTEYPNFEIILIDDNSNDGTKEYLEKMGKDDSRLKVIETLQRKGLTKSRNLGIEISTGEYIAFAEVDMLFDRNWLIRAIEVLEKDKTLGMVCGKVLDVKTHTIINAVGIKTIPNIGWVVSRGIGETDTGQYDESIECSSGSVGAIARASVIREIRGFDESLDRIDDTDFGWRIWLIGYRIITVPTSVTYHVVVKKWKLRKRNVTKIQQEMSFGRVLRILAKNYEPHNLVIYFPQAVLILLIRSFFNLFKGNVYSLTGFILILVWFIRTLPSTIAERSLIQSNRISNDKLIFEKIMVKENLLQIYFLHAREVYRRLLKVPQVG